MTKREWVVHTRLQKWRRSLSKPLGHQLQSVMHGIVRIFAPLRVRLEWTLRAFRTKGPTGLSRPVRITLTSYPPRFGTLALTLKSLLNQSVRADCVVVWVHAPDAALLPKSVTRLKSHGLRIEEHDRDLKVYLKQMPALRSDPNAIWITADDDVFYPRDWLALLLDAHRRDPEAVVCRRAHLLAFDAEGRLLPYARWPKQTNETDPQAPLFLTGIGGVLYPPGSLYADATDDTRFLALSPNADDIWLNWMVRLNRTRIRRVGDAADPVTWLSSQRVSLFRRNARGSNNDECLTRMEAAYGVECLRGSEPHPGAWNPPDR